MSEIIDTMYFQSSFVFPYFPISAREARGEKKREKGSENNERWMRVNVSPDRHPIDDDVDRKSP